MRIGYRFVDEGDRLHVYSSSLKNTELLSFEQEWFDTTSAVELTRTTTYPNILATKTIHPETSQPLFYRMKLPLFSFTDKNEVVKSVKIVKGNEEIDSDKYYVTYDASNILIYTNLQNTTEPYEIVFTPYPNSTLSRSSKLLLNTEPAMKLNSDYSVVYDGSFKLSEELYVKPNPAIKGTLTHLYEANLNIPWYVFVNPLTTRHQTINPANNTVSLTLEARRLSEGLYKLNARDIESVEGDVKIYSFSNDGFVKAKSSEYVLSLKVSIKTNCNIIKRDGIPFDFRPTINNYHTYNIHFN